MSRAETRRMPSTWTRVEIDRAAERQAGQDGQLVGGVDAVDVEAGVGLGVAQLLGLGQHLGELAAALAHRGEDVVAGAVEDAGDAADAVAGQALAQRLDHRDAAGHRRLEGQRARRAARPRAASAAPCTASSALLAVTTGLPAASAASTSARAGPSGAADQLDHHVDRRRRRPAPPDRRTSAGRRATRRGRARGRGRRRR